MAIAGGSSNLTNVTVASNSATGGDGGKVPGNNKWKWWYSDGAGGYGLGGGIYVDGGSVTVTQCTVKQNTAAGVTYLSPVWARAAAFTSRLARWSCWTAQQCPTPITTTPRPPVQTSTDRTR